jgi:Tfp pilus assembly protein PilF
MDKDYNKALNAVNKAIETSPKAFWMFLLEAKIEKELGDKVSAKASAESCITIATEAKNTDYVRMATLLIKSL